MLKQIFLFKLTDDLNGKIVSEAVFRKPKAYSVAFIDKDLSKKTKRKIYQNFVTMAGFIPLRLVITKKANTDDLKQVSKVECFKKDIDEVVDGL